MNKYQKILYHYWGYHSFRDLQEEIIESVAAGKDTLGLMPTGGGKSITFQVFSLANEGLCLVITPLIALMKDQVENLNKRGIKAIAIYSGMSKREINLSLNNATWGNYKFLYVSPERIATPAFRERLEQMKINLITIDESHCISQWGYDFRPSYLKIASIREILPKIPILALTATATPVVVKDIQEKLLFKKENVLQKSFIRSNLNYIVRHEEDKEGYISKILNKTKGSGIIYVRSRRRTKEIAQLLISLNISADFYHAGLSNKSRSAKQEAWKDEKTRIMVATNAFGMGIDKSNVRFVIHIDVPDSLEAYYQEAGRAGRDEKRAVAVLLYNKSDVRKLEKGYKEKFPPIDVIKNIYQKVGNFYSIPIGFGKGKVFDFSISQFAKAYKLPIITIFNSLKILERCDYLQLTEDLDHPTRVNFIVHRDELYKFQVDNEHFDQFVKLLLRSHSGLFTDYVNINEQALALQMDTSPETIYNFLNKLSQNKIIHYIPQKKTPYIIFLKERIEDRYIKIANEHYEERKQMYRKQIDSVLKYAQAKAKCRSQSLVEYFGEENSKRCGVCDICKSRNPLNIDSLKFEQFVAQIKKILNQESITLEQLIKKVNGNQSDAENICEWLIKTNKICLNSENKLSWNNDNSVK